MIRQQAVLATDLDGTLIPLADHERNQEDLEELRQLLQQHRICLVFVTGRDLQLVKEALHEQALPVPHWLIADVGTSLFECSQGQFAAVDAYEQRLAHIVRELPIDQLREKLEPLTSSQLRFQEPDKQGLFKLSFYADAAALDGLAATIERTLETAPWNMIVSVDPFTGDGLIDLLPVGVSKSYALSWWTEHVQIESGNVIFAGDSGNDFAALTAGYRTILVGNADRRLADRVQTVHQLENWKDRLYLATGHATSGVLEGCHEYGLFS